MRVLIFGLGQNEGGVGSAAFFAKKGDEVRVTDLKNREILKNSLDKLKDYQIQYSLGQHKYEDIDWADLIIKNPAIKPGNDFINYAIKEGKAVETDMGIFLQYVKPDQIIGITGTKGKSTTSSLIYETLKAAGKNVILAGNIGISVLETIHLIKSDTIIVLEISSFQLESFAAHKVSPKWAIITNITPDHLNYHDNMEEYTLIKKTISQYQSESDYLFLRKDDPVTTKADFLKELKAKIVYFCSDDLPVDFHPNLLGEHNRQNLAAVFQLGKTFDINSDLLLRILTNFKGVPFRMELTGEWQGIRIYNDTTATSPEAGIHAIKTFPGCILIAGGMNKGMDYTEYAKALTKNARIVFFLEGDSTDSILLSLREAKRRGNLRIYGSYNDLEKLLMDVKKIAKPGDVILFSPAATSFNLFQNEFDRGRKFNEVVKKIFS